MLTKTVAARRHLYLAVIGALTLCGSILRALALCLQLDPVTGYFAEPAFLPAATLAIQILTVLLCLAPLFLFAKEELPTKRAPLSMAELIGCAVAVLCCVATAVYLFPRIYALPAPSVLVVAAILFLFIAAAFFATCFLGKPAPLCGYGVILAAALLLSITYFDRYTPMNAPHKVSVHLCLLSVMAYMLYDIRISIQRALPRALLAVSGICFSLCATIGVSNLIAFAAGVYDSPLYLLCDLFLIALALYVAARTVTPLLPQSPAEAEPLPAEDDAETAAPIPEDAADEEDNAP